MQRGKFTINNEKIQAGVWECTVGGFDVKDRTNYETCYIISGKAKITDLKDNSVKELGPGSSLILTIGISIHWDIIEPVRKFFTIAL